MSTISVILISGGVLLVSLMVNKKKFSPLEERLVGKTLKMSFASVVATVIFFILYDIFIFYTNGEVIFFSKHDYRFIISVGIAITFLYCMLMSNLILLNRILKIRSPRKLPLVKSIVLFSIPFLILTGFFFKRYFLITNDSIMIPIHQEGSLFIEERRVYAFGDIRSISFEPNLRKVSGGRNISAYLEMCDSYKITFKDGYVWNTENHRSFCANYDFDIDMKEHEISGVRRVKNKDKEYKSIKSISTSIGVPIENEKDILLIPPTVYYYWLTQD